MSVVERVRAIVEPILGARSVGLYDIEHSGASLRILVETGDLTVIEELTRAISRALDESDPLPDRYLLEVSSPGLERPLRTEAHFTHAIGEQATVKTVAGTEGERRVKGTITAVGDGAVTVRDEAGAERTIPLDAIEKARTVFTWDAAPKKPKSTTEKVS